MTRLVAPVSSRPTATHVPHLETGALALPLFENLELP